MSMTEWTLTGSAGQPILGNTHTPDSGQPAGVLIVSHGFKGYKDYGFFPHLADAAADAGLIGHRFNFSHSGMTNRIETFEHPELFEADTWGKQVDDLLAVNDAVADGRLAGAGLPVVWFGHSRGGIATILAAARLFDQNSPVCPAAVIPIATPHDAVAGFDEQTRDFLRRQGYVESPSSRTGQALRVGLAWLEEIEQDPNAYDPALAIARIACPIQLIHGQTDPTVPVASSQILARSAGANASVKTIPNAGHTFNCPNPLPAGDAPPPETKAMVQAVCDFAMDAAKSN